jgi:hypothetical protein
MNGTRLSILPTRDPSDKSIHLPFIFDGEQLDYLATAT